MFISLIFIGCSKDKSDDVFYDAIVLQKGTDCGESYLIKFDDDIMKNSLSSDDDRTYYEINLPQEYKVEGKRIKVQFRQPTADELMLCTMMDFSFSQIYITNLE
jgi:hypothetical protein